MGLGLQGELLQELKKKSHLGIYGNVTYSQLFITHLFK